MHNIFAHTHRIVSLFWHSVLYETQLRLQHTHTQTHTDTKSNDNMAIIMIRLWKNYQCVLWKREQASNSKTLLQSLHGQLKWETAWETAGRRWGLADLTDHLDVLE